MINFRYRQRLTRIVLLAVLFSFMAAFPSFQAYADDPIQVVSQSAVGVLGKSITFSIRVKSLKGNVVAGRLYVNFPGLHTDTHDVAPKSAGSEVDIQYTWDISRYDSPPWQIAIYHWEITNSSGQKLTTPQASGEITDDSHDWIKLTDGKVSVYYYDQPKSFGKALLKATQTGYSRVAKSTGHIPQYEIRVVIYANQDDFCEYHRTQGCLQWVGGETDAGITIQYLTPDYDSANRYLFNETIPHELAHAFLHEWLGANSIAMTQWFDEGQAVNNQIEGLDYYLKRAIDMAKNGRLWRVRQMGSTLFINPNDSDRVLDWYAEAASLVAFMFGRWRTTSLGKIVTDLSKGQMFETALKDVTGLTLDQYETQWRAWVGAPALSTP